MAPRASFISAPAIPRRTRPAVYTSRFFTYFAFFSMN